MGRNQKIADLSDFKVHLSVGETKQMIEIWLGDDEGERYTLAIIFKETEEVAGFIRIYDISKKNRTCKIELIVGKKWLNAAKEKSLKSVAIFYKRYYNIVTEEKIWM